LPPINDRHQRLEGSRIVRRLGIEPEKQRGSTSRGQLISYITAEDGSRVVEYLPRSVVADDSVKDRPFNGAEDERCVFYLLLLEPNHDPGRLKVGIADNLAERLRHLRCSAPLIEW
jgi:hypothetical protein